MSPLLKPPRRPPRKQPGSWSAKDERKVVGLILFLVGLFMAVIGAAISYSDYTRLTSEQLAWKTIAETLAPELGITGLGIFLMVLGL